MINAISIPFFLLEVCISFSIIWNFIRIQSQLSTTQCIIPLVIHYFLFFIKIALLYKKSLNQGQISNRVWMATLLMQSCGLGLMSLYYEVPVCFLQVLIGVQYIIALSLDDLYKPGLFIVLNFLIPEIFTLAYQTYDLLEKIVEAIITIYLLYYLIKKKQINKKDLIDISEIRSAVQSKSLFHLSLFNRMPFLTNETFAIINEKIEIIYEQKLEYFLEENQDFIQYDETKKEVLFQNLLEIKCDSFSVNLSKLMIQQEQSIGQKQIRTKVSLDVICSQILSEDSSPKEFFQIFELESQSLKLSNVKLNLYALMDDQSKCQMIIIHFEQYQEKKLIQTKSFGTISNPIQNASFLTGQKTQDSVSSSLFSNIFKSISHEFGTYLNCILTIGQLGTLSEFIDMDLKRQYFEPIFINAKLLNYILQNIRDFNTILQNKFQLRLQEFNPFEILTEIKYLMSQQAESRNNTIELNCAEDIIIYNDSDRFKQVIYQLVSNSIRFTLNGQIYIEITNYKDKIKVTVIDQGIGMSLDEQNKLNQLLRDSKKMLKISHNSVGCGLGLSISNEIVKKMNGSISGIHFTSQLNQGSTFHFTINNAIQLYNESQYNLSQSIVKVINDAYYIERGSEYSHRMSMSGYQFLPLEDKFSDSLEKYNTLGFKQKSVSYRNRSYDTSHQFLHRQTENSNSKGKSEDYPNHQEQSLIVIPNIETKMKTNIIQYKISSECCKRALVIDDEYFNIFSLKMILTRFNVKIDSAFNGKQALEKCHQKMAQPCKICKNSGYMVIFIDLNMPVMDGFATIKELKNQMSQNLIPRGLCIVNSGFADFESKEKANAAGADMYLTKPINIIELEEYLREHFPYCL